MKEEILQNIDHPEQLEKLYRKDNSAFIKSFNQIYPDYKDNQNIQFWNLRLNYKEEKISLGVKKELWVVIILAIVAGLYANISNLPKVNPELFFLRNTSFLILPFVAMYFLWKQQVAVHKIIIIGGIIATLAFYINMLPNAPQSSSLNLVYIHMPMLLWSILGYTYLGNHYNDNNKRVNFLKYNGDFIIMTGVIALACMVFNVLTFGLFDLIGIKIAQFYMQYIAIWAIGAIPLFATFLIQNNPSLISKISPLIAKIFTPLVFINLFIYLMTIIYTGKYPFNDRNLLLLYNLLLVIVLALIFFSIAEKSEGEADKWSYFILLGLSLVTIAINIIALSAISFRIAQWGITPNRMAVLGGNILIFIHLLLVCWSLLKVIRDKASSKSIKDTIAKYLPVYAVWTLIVVALFPLLFQWK
jgi:hypothetical protein